MGILSEAQETELELRGWEVEPAPAELVPDEGSTEVPRDRYKMVFVDASMFEIMSGPNWDRGDGRRFRP